MHQVCACWISSNGKCELIISWNHPPSLCVCVSLFVCVCCLSPKCRSEIRGEHFFRNHITFDIALYTPIVATKAPKEVVPRSTSMGEIPLRSVTGNDAVMRDASTWNISLFVELIPLFRGLKGKQRENPPFWGPPKHEHAGQVLRMSQISSGWADVLQPVAQMGAFFFRNHGRGHVAYGHLTATSGCSGTFISGCLWSLGSWSWVRMAPIVNGIALVLPGNGKAQQQYSTWELEGKSGAMVQ